MKKLFTAIILLVGSSLALASEASYLFFQTAQTGQLIKNSNGRGFQLLIKKPPAYVSYFADRPVRRSGTIPLKTFLALWQQEQKEGVSFKQVPPNVAITMHLGQHDEQSLMVVVSNPQIKNSVLTYDIQRLNPKKVVIDGKMTDLNLFFDGIHWNPGGF